MRELAAVIERAAILGSGRQLRIAAALGVDLLLQLDGRGLTIAVQDHRPGGIRRRPSIDATNPRGLGLFVVDRLSRSWGTRPTADGKKVWALLLTPS